MAETVPDRELLDLMLAIHVPGISRLTASNLDSTDERCTLTPPAINDRGVESRVLFRVDGRTTVREEHVQREIQLSLSHELVDESMALAAQPHEVVVALLSESLIRAVMELEALGRAAGAPGRVGFSEAPTTPPPRCRPQIRLVVHVADSHACAFGL